MAYLSDYELIRGIKETDNNDLKLTLFQRYTPFVQKTFLRFSKKNSFMYTHEFEFDDFHSDSYFSFLKAIEYTDLKKIYDIKNWKFLGVFGYYLTLQCNRYFLHRRRKKNIQRHLVHFTKDISEVTFVFKDEEVFSESSTIHSYNPEQMFLKKECVNAFLKSLTPFEKEILKVKEEIKLEGSIPSSKSIADTLGYNTLKVRKALSRMKEKFFKIRKLYGFEVLYFKEEEKNKLSINDITRKNRFITA